MKLVNLGHDVRRKVVDRPIPAVLALLKIAAFDIGGADPLDVGFRNAVGDQRPYIFDSRALSNPHDRVFGLFDIVELDRHALEELIVEVHADPSVSLDIGVDPSGILGFQSATNESAHAFPI